MITLKVLLVDNNAGFRGTVASFLKRQHGVEVIGEEEDGLGAIEQSEKLQPDLVVMDLDLPRCNGFEAARAIKAMKPDTRVVLLSMHSRDVYRTAATKVGADDFVEKNSMKYALEQILTDEQGRRAAMNLDAA